MSIGSDFPEVLLVVLISCLPKSLWQYFEKVMNSAHHQCLPRSSKKLLMIVYRDDYHYCIMNKNADSRECLVLVIRAFDCQP